MLSAQISTGIAFSCLISQCAVKRRTQVHFSTSHADRLSMHPRVLLSICHPSLPVQLRLIIE